MRFVPVGKLVAIPSTSLLWIEVPNALARQATGTGGSSGAALAASRAATAADPASSTRPRFVSSARREVTRLETSHASAAASAAEIRGDAEVSTAAAGTSATNSTAEHHSVRA